MDKTIALCEIDLSPGTEITPESELDFLASNFCLVPNFVIVIENQKISFVVIDFEGMNQESLFQHPYLLERR